MFEVVGVLLPWPVIVEILDRILVVCVESVSGRVNKLYGVLDLYRWSVSGEGCLMRQAQLTPRFLDVHRDK